MRLLGRIVRAVNGMSVGVGKFTSFAVLLLTIIELYEVVSRYVFNAPTIWASEVGTYLSGTLWLFSGAYAQSVDAHIRVDILYGRLSQRSKSIMESFTAPFAITFLIAVFIYLFKAGIESYVGNEHSTSQWAPPVYIIKLIIPFAVLLLLIQYLAKLMHDMTYACSERDLLSATGVRSNSRINLRVLTSISLWLVAWAVFTPWGLAHIETIHMSAGTLIIVLFGSMFLIMLTGTPILYSMGIVCVFLLFLLRGQDWLPILAIRAWDAVDNPVIICLPMFIFMGVMIEKAGIADNLYNAMHKWSGGIAGGLAVGTVLICMIMAAMTGVSATATLTMGLTALPEMLKRGYHKNLAIGCVAGGGALGILIPPSVSMVIYALVAQASIGQLFIGGIIPGVILGFLFIIYILIRCWIQPKLGPPLPVQERASWSEKTRSLKTVVLPSIIIIAVLGSIFR